MLTTSQIYDILELKNPAILAEETQANEEDPTSPGRRQSGRTTRTIIQALSLASEGKTVVIEAPTLAIVRHIQRQANNKAHQLNIPAANIVARTPNQHNHLGYHIVLHDHTAIKK